MVWNALITSSYESSPLPSNSARYSRTCCELIIVICINFVFPFGSKGRLVFVQLCQLLLWCLLFANLSKTTCLYHALCTDFRKISIVIGNTKIKRTVLSQLRQVNRCSPRLFCNTTIDPVNLLLVSLLPH